MPRTAYTSADREPTWTLKILDAMRTRDDFMTMAQIREATRASFNQASATLHHLKRFRAVECFESEGALWWYATGEDTRSKTVDARVVEHKGNRARRKITPPPSTA